MCEYLVISDLHLGNLRNPTSEIVNGLKEYFVKLATTDLDIIFIAGDTFDTLLELPSIDVNEIFSFCNFMLKFCSRYNIQLRILEGTPSHDWGQGSLFVTLNSLRTEPIDLLYINELMIEHNSFGISILYIPDEWSSTTAETLILVKQLLHKNDLSKVDIVIMHGQFGYQLPMIKNNSNTHSETEYLQLVNYFIHIGHIHQHSHHDKIIASGSFDRLQHGDEDVKGGIYVKLKPNKTWEFIPNINAKSFVTIDIRELDTKKSMQLISDKVCGMLNGSYVRLLYDGNSNINIKELQLKHPFFHFTKQLKNTDANVFLNPRNKLFDVTLDTLILSSTTIMSELQKSMLKYKLNDSQKQYVDLVLSE